MILVANNSTHLADNRVQELHRMAGERQPRLLVRDRGTVGRHLVLQLPDGRVYCVYYEEGAGSSIRGTRLKVSPAGVTLDRSSD